MLNQMKLIEKGLIYIWSSLRFQVVYVYIHCNHNHHTNINFVIIYKGVVGSRWEFECSL